MTNSIFIISQIIIFIAIIFDFLSFQFKNRKKTIFCLIISGILIAGHYFLLSKILAGVLILLAAIRLFIAFFTTNEKVMYSFLIISFVLLIFTYNEVFDFVIYIGSLFMIVGNFQSDNKLMRKFMMCGSLFYITYNILIFSPMAIALEGLFLSSNVIGYYRHYYTFHLIL